MATSHGVHQIAQRIGRMPRSIFFALFSRTDERSLGDSCKIDTNQHCFQRHFTPFDPGRARLPCVKLSGQLLIEVPVSVLLEGLWRRPIWLAFA